MRTLGMLFIILSLFVILFRLVQPLFKKKTKLRYDDRLGVYPVYHSGFVYEIKAEVIQSLELFLQNNKVLAISDWYQNLSADQKTMVKKRIQRRADKHRIKVRFD